MLHRKKKSKFASLVPARKKKTSRTKKAVGIGALTVASGIALGAFTKPKDPA